MRLFRKTSNGSSSNNNTPNSAKRSSAASSKKGSNKNGASSGGSRSADGKSTVFRVTVPEGTQPGQEFQVYAGNRIVRVRCPMNSKPGTPLQITVPNDEPEAPPSSSSLASSSNSLNHNNHKSNPTIPDSENVEKLADGAYMVTVPDGIRGGQQFPVVVSGQTLMVTSPANARPGTKVRVVPPPPPRTTGGHAASTSSSSTNNNKPPKDENEEPTQLFEVQVPPGVQPGRPFALLAGGVRVLVTCPSNAQPGQRIRFKLPISLTQKRQPASEAAAIKLKYDKDGWTRTIRLSDMKFQWVRMDDKGDVENNLRFSPEKSAYVRKLDFRPGSDDRVRDAVLSLVPATDAFVDSKVRGNNGEVIVTYSEIADAQVQNFEDKAKWFQEKCLKLCVDWNEGHMRINVRREYLLEDSVDAVMSLSRRDMRKLWRFDFIGEMGIDAGGLAREWFQLVTSEIFDPDMGLWQSSDANQMMMMINPASRFIHDDYLVYYRFLGRVMGKALFDRQLVAGHMVHYLYKHMLGWPITFKDIESVDEEYYNSLKQLKELAEKGEDLSMLCLDFSTTQEVMGVKEVVDLIENGQDVEVDNDNFPEYLEACFKHRMLERIKPQLNELLLGFFDVIPEPLLTVFDFQELELLMCGLPEIDIEDWKEHTEYSGDYEGIGSDCPVCQWFWDVVEEMDQEMKARLLQFVTGTSGVPSRGFGVLQGNDGNIRKFTIHGVSLDICLYPRAHTCFNRIDLPHYETKDDLREKLKLAVTMVATGFDIE